MGFQLENLILKENVSISFAKILFKIKCQKRRKEEEELKGKKWRELERREKGSWKIDEINSKAS